jgi:uncharacterized membrane protein YfcA
MFGAIFTQSLAGFGLALVAMPLLVEMGGIGLAAPLIALVAATSEITLLWRYRRSLKLKAVGRLSIASLVAIPLGVYGVRQLDSQLIPFLLGVILLAYSLYALITPRLPELRHPAWAYAFGFVAGLLSGAYNTSGPPVVVYGNCRQWLPAEFKGNLQGFFLLNSVAVLFSHAVGGSFTQPVWLAYAVSLPLLAAGLAAGLALDRYIDPARFRKIVLILLLVLGLRLVL